MKCANCGGKDFETRSEVQYCIYCDQRYEQTEQKGSGSDVKIIEKTKRACVAISTDFGCGSGFVLADNLVVTNAHVIGMQTDNGFGVARNIFAEFDKDVDTRKYPLTLKKISINEDVAIMEISGYSRADRVELDDSAKIKQGEYVFTIGSPLGMRFTFTDGKISNPDFKERDLKYQGKIIQTNMIINPGNSGGGLLNAHGKIIGMCTFNLTKNNNLMVANSDSVFSVITEIPGMSFAVASNTIREVLSDKKYSI